MAAPSQTIDLIAYNFNIETSDFLTTLQKAARPSLMGESYMHTLAREGDVLTVELMLQTGTAFDQPDAQGMRPLHEAARYGHKDVLAILLDHGARCDAPTDPLGTSALMLAVENAHYDVVQMMLRRGADLKARDRLSGRGLLHIAAANGDMKMLGLLISAGCGVFSEDKQGMTARDYAARNRHAETEKALVKIMAHHARFLH